MTESLWFWIVVAFGFLSFYQYQKYERMYRDAMTDMIGIMVRNDIPREELRRTTDHEIVKEKFDD